jgi:hypothetical protein
VRYDSTDGNQSLSLAMNRGDVTKLLEQCSRALKKAQLAADVVNGQAHIPTIISGEDEND